jgi:hypothetical protein
MVGLKPYLASLERFDRFLLQNNHLASGGFEAIDISGDLPRQIANAIISGGQKRLEVNGAIHRTQNSNGLQNFENGVGIVGASEFFQGSIERGQCNVSADGGITHSFGGEGDLYRIVALQTALYPGAELTGRNGIPGYNCPARRSGRYMPA